jgi:hypothetical protein
MDCIVKMPDGTADWSLAMTIAGSDVFYRAFSNTRGAIYVYR